MNLNFIRYTFTIRNGDEKVWVITLKRGGVEFTESKVFLNIFLTKPVRSVYFK